MKDDLMKGNPLELFRSWYTEATASGEKHPEAMTLATASKRGRPSARIVLYKGLSQGAFRIFTNYESRKGRELIENPWASLTFHWKQLDRQVRIEGRVSRMSRKQSERYFHGRPRLSQIGAWASKQSHPIPSRESLMDNVRHYERLFLGRKVPLPPHWGGFLLIPQRIEFWKEGEFRLHDRFLFERSARAGRWKVSRLSP